MRRWRHSSQTCGAMIMLKTAIRAISVFAILFVANATVGVSGPYCDIDSCSKDWCLNTEYCMEAECEWDQVGFPHCSECEWDLQCNGAPCGTNNTWSTCCPRPAEGLLAGNSLC